MAEYNTDNDNNKYTLPKGILHSSPSSNSSGRIVMQHGARHICGSWSPATGLTNPEYWGTPQDLPDERKWGGDSGMQAEGEFKVRLEQDQSILRKSIFLKNLFLIKNHFSFELFFLHFNFKNILVVNHSSMIGQSTKSP